MSEPPPPPPRAAVESSGLYHYPQYLDALGSSERKTKAEKSLIIKIVLSAIIALTPIVAGSIVLYAKIQIHGYQIVQAQEDIDWIETHLSHSDFISEDELYAHNDAVLMQIRSIMVDLELLKQNYEKNTPGPPNQ